MTAPENGEMPQVDTAVILCGGGESRRAGVDKQLLPCGGTTLPIAIGRKLRTLFREIIIVTNTPALYAGCGLVVVQDIVAGAGPLGGIITGLTWASSEYAYVTAGDMPNVNLRYIEWMMRMLGRWDTSRGGDAGRQRARRAFHLDLRTAVRPIDGGSFPCPRLNGAWAVPRGCGSATFVAEETARLFSPDWSMFASINTRRTCSDSSPGLPPALHELLQGEAGVGKPLAEPFHFLFQGTLAVEDVHELALVVPRGDLGRLDDRSAVNGCYRFQRGSELVLDVRRYHLKGISAHANAPEKLDMPSGRGNPCVEAKRAGASDQSKSW